MAALLLSVHVLAAVVFIGPVTVAVSLFPRFARQALGNDGADATAAVPTVHLLHRLSRVYAVLALAVPVFGLATALRLGVLGDAWVLLSIALTVAAAVILGGVVLPRQGLVRLAADEPAAARRGTTAVATGPALASLAVASGLFNLLWAAVVVLMIVRPGSTTGV